MNTLFCRVTERRTLWYIKPKVYVMTQGDKNSELRILSKMEGFDLVRLLTCLTSREDTRLEKETKNSTLFSPFSLSRLLEIGHRQCSPC